MKDFIDNILYMYNQFLDFGINPLSILIIIFLTDVLKKSLPIIYTHKLRRLWIMLTSLTLSIALTFLFYFFSYFSVPMFIVNIIINMVFSSYSTEILKTLEQVKDHFLKKDNSNGGTN